jgi:hypothetical protein
MVRRPFRRRNTCVPPQDRAATGSELARSDNPNTLLRMESPPLPSARTRCPGTTAIATAVLATISISCPPRPGRSCRRTRRWHCRSLRRPASKRATLPLPIPQYPSRRHLSFVATRIFADEFQSSESDHRVPAPNDVIFPFCSTDAPCRNAPDAMTSGRIIRAGLATQRHTRRR